MSDYPLIGVSDFSCGHCYRTVSNDTTLIGGYRTRLCNECSNLFQSFMSENPTFIRLCDIEDEIVMLQHMSICDGVNRSAEVKSARDNHRLYTIELFDISKDWVESL
jgi:hypothetical protein